MGIHKGTEIDIHNRTDMEYTMEHKLNTKWNRNEIQHGTEMGIQSGTDM